MNKTWLSLYARIGLIFILTIETTRASLSTLQHNSVPESESTSEENPDDFQQRSDDITSLSEHLKINNLLHKHLDSNERLLNKQLTLNLQNPELNFNKELTSELFSDKQNRFNSGESSKHGKEHPSILSISHLISPHLKDDDFQIDRPTLGPELAQNYQRELHEALKSHHRNLHQALQNKHNNLQNEMNKYHVQNAQNFNLNSYGEHGSLSSGPNEESLYQNGGHLAYNHENSKPQNENAYISPPSNPNPSLGQQELGYQGGHSPVISNDYQRPIHNNDDTHPNAYVQTERPHDGVKGNTYGSKEYYYENQKVHAPVSYVNDLTGYGIGGKEGNVGNNNLKLDYPNPSKAYQDFKDYNPNDNIKPNQYDISPNSHRNKNPYEAVAHKYENFKNQYVQTNHGSNNGGYNENYQSGNTYVQEGPVNINKNNVQAYNANPYNGYNQNPHSYNGNAEVGNNNYGKTGNMYNQQYRPGSNNPRNKDGPHSNYNQNSGIKNNNPQAYSLNNGYNNNGNKYYNSPSLGPNAGHVNSYNQNNQANSQGVAKDYNPMQYKQVFTGAQNYNNKGIHNDMYYNGKAQNGYNRNSPVDDRKRYHAPVQQAKSHTGRGYYNNNLPQKPNMNNHNGKHLHNSAPFVPPNNSPYTNTGRSNPNSKSNNQDTVRPYSALNQNGGRQMNPNNFDASKGSLNPQKNNFNGAANSNNRGGNENNSYIRRRGMPLKAPISSPNAKTSKVLSAPIIHQIYMSDPLIQEGMFLAGMV